MCGRFTLRASKRTVADALAIVADQIPELDARYNIAPKQEVLILRGGHEAALARWGLIPSWAKDAKIGKRHINARAETVASKPSFRSAFKSRRCLVVADGFFEWQKTTGKTKQPFYIRLTDEKPFGFAGLWERWHAPDDEVVESCSIITTDPNELMQPIHNRMPVILDRGAHDRWLDPKSDPADLGELLKPFSADRMVATPISTFVNSPKNQGPACIEPAANPA
jgi:putative SOS response-associated peptidase YedK